MTRISLLFFCIILLSAGNIQAENKTPSDTSFQNAVEADSLEIDTLATKRSIFYRALNQTKPITGLAFPIVYYTPETNLMFGVAGVVSWRQNKDSTNAPSIVVPWFTYSIDKQIIAEIFGNFYFKGNSHQLSYELSFRKEKMPFYGIGNRLYKDKENKELVDMQRYRVNIAYQHRMKDIFLVGGIYDLDYVGKIQPEPNKKMDTTNYLGSSGGFNHGLGINLSFDNRDDLYFPYKGHYFDAKLIGYPTFLGSKYQFATLEAEYRSFINIKRKVILASQIISQMSFGDVPFYKMPALGGKHILRGYTMGTGRDNFLFNLQGELRVPLNRFVLIGFFGSGIVGDEFMEYFKVKDYTYSIGTGVRFRPFKDKNVAARLDVGFWQKTFGVYFVLNEAF